MSINVQRGTRYGLDITGVHEEWIVDSVASEYHRGLGINVTIVTIVNEQGDREDYTLDEFASTFLPVAVEL